MAIKAPSAILAQMGALEKRRLRVLRLMYEYPIALPKRAIYVNLRREYNFPFTEETVGTRVDELVEDGHLEKIDIGNGYYAVTKDGKQYFEANRHKIRLEGEI